MGGGERTKVTSRRSTARRKSGVSTPEGRKSFSGQPRPGGAVGEEDGRNPSRPCCRRPSGRDLVASAHICLKDTGPKETRTRCLKSTLLWTQSFAAASPFPQTVRVKQNKCSNSPLETAMERADEERPLLHVQPPTSPQVAHVSMMASGSTTVDNHRFLLIRHLI